MRWCQYAADGHGGNARLRQLIANTSTAQRRFRYAVLRTLPQTTNRDEVLALKASYKAKFGSRAHGLNGK